MCVRVGGAARGVVLRAVAVDGWCIFRLPTELGTTGERQEARHRPDLRSQVRPLRSPPTAMRSLCEAKRRAPLKGRQGQDQFPAKSDNF